MALPISAKAAEEAPKLELISPTFGRLITLDSPIEVTLRITGGFAAKTSDCIFPQKNTGTRHIGLIAQIDDENGNKLFWRGKGVYDGYLSTISARPKIISNGIECTLTFNDASDQAWQKSLSSNVEIASLITQNPNEEFTFGKVKNLTLISFVYDTPSSSGSSITSLSRNSFLAEPGTKSSISFIDIARGDVIDYKKSFGVILNLKKGLKIEKFDSSEACSKPKFESTVNNIDKYIANCVTWVGYPTGRATALGTYTIKASATISNGEPVSGEEIILNIGRTERPIVNFSVYGVENGPGFRLKASGRMFLAKDGSVEENVANQEYRFCVAGICKQGKSDSRGEFVINTDLSEASIKKIRSASSGIGWTFTAIYNELNYFSLNDISNIRSGKQQTSPGIISGFEVLPEAAKRDVKPSVNFSSFSSPNKIKWGNYITVKYKAIGKGTVLCAAYFQPNATQGIFTFYATGGKSGIVKFKPWYFKLASYPLQIACSPRPGGGLSFGEPRDVYSLGNVTITK